MVGDLHDDAPATQLSNSADLFPNVSPEGMHGGDDDDIAATKAPEQPREPIFPGLEGLRRWMPKALDTGAASAGSVRAVQAELEVDLRSVEFSERPAQGRAPELTAAGEFDEPFSAHADECEP